MDDYQEYAEVTEKVNLSPWMFLIIMIMVLYFVCLILIPLPQVALQFDHVDHCNQKGEK